MGICILTGCGDRSLDDGNEDDDNRKDSSESIWVSTLSNSMVDAGRFGPVAMGRSVDDTFPDGIL